VTRHDPRPHDDGPTRELWHGPEYVARRAERARLMFVREVNSGDPQRIRRASAIYGEWQVTDGEEG